MMITLNLEKDFLKDIDNTVKAANYANRTELIREALRDKLVEVKQRELIATIKAIQRSKHKVTKEEYERVRRDPHEFDSEELLRRVGLGNVRKK